MNPFKKLVSTGLAWLWLAILVVAIDRYTKIWMVNHLTYQEPFQVLPFFNLALYHNTGAAFSFLHNASGWQNWLLGSLAFIISIIIVCWLAKLPARDRWTNIALCFILGGALGNAWDRINYQYVIDFLSFHLGTWYFAIFNTADAAICLGAFMLFLAWCKQPKS
jgi:signal peptidase II